MPKGFLPNPDAALLGWSLNFKTLITATPAAYGISPARAAAYAGLHDAYAAALALVDPAIRNRTSVAVKNAARAALRLEASLLSRIVKGQPTVTDAQRVSLGVNVRARPTPVPVPVVPPGLRVSSGRGCVAHLMLFDVASPRRKPVGVSGAAVFSYVGATPPASLKEWTFRGNTGKDRFDVVLSTTLAPGTTVWFVALWFNTRKQGGPVCAPVAVNLIGGGVALAA